MIQRSMRQLADMIGNAEVAHTNEYLQVRGVSTDTRSIKPGSLFVPIIGPRFNGHDYVREAVANGAVASLWDRSEPDPPSDIPLLLVEDTLLAIQQLAGAYRRLLNVKVVGITGSNGKTSTKDILASVLATTFKTQKTSGNLNNHLGVPLTLLQLEEDTEMAVVEMGMSSLGEIERLSHISQLDAAIITNVSEVHLGDLKSRDRIAQAKLEILHGLKVNGLFVYHGDSSRLVQQLNENFSGNTTTSFGEATINPWHPTSFSLNEAGISFTISDPWSPGLHLPMLGKHQLINALSAIAVARHFGISYAYIQQGLQQVEATGMRNELVRTGELTIINDTYKSNPTSLRAALDSLYELTGYNQKIAVLGDMVELGDEAAAFHTELGAELDADRIDLLITLGPMANLMAQSASLHWPADRVIACFDQQEVITQLGQVIQSKCLILVKGSRSLQMEKIVEALCDQVSLC